jgi:putative aldouronate transport system substrate-binding protein
MKKVRFLCLILVVLLTAALFSGFRIKIASKFSGIDTSKEVKLTMYLIGTAPAGMPEVLKALNKKLKADINATIDLNYFGWGDLQSKYPLVLASGDDVDLIYASDWAYYQQEAVKGAFREITQTDLKTYMPKIFAAVDKSAFSQTEVDGKNYMIPTSSPDRKIPVALIRGDLRKKYKLPVIKSFDKIEPYLAAIKKNEPNMIPMNLDSQYDIIQPYSFLEKAFGFNANPLQNAIGVYFDIFSKTGLVGDQLTLYPSNPFKKAAVVMKRWYDLGYVNKNPFANKVRSKETIVQGKSGVAFGNSIDIQTVLAKAEQLGMDLEIIPVLTQSGKTPADTYLNNGMAVAANSRNPERAMMALNLIMQEPSYVMLTYFGIKGKNYEITDDGKIGLPKGVTADTNTYPPDAAGFWFVNKNLFKPVATWTADYIAHKALLKSYLINSLLQAFSFDPGRVKTEVINLTAVENQYAYPIYMGAVNNVDTAIALYKQKQKLAGLPKVMAEAKKQIAVFIAKQKK